MVPTDDGNGYVDPDGKTWQELNSKQKKFVREYVKGQNATEAAVKAGYTKNRNAAKRQGSVLLNHNPLVRNYLIEQEIEAEEREKISMESHLSALHDLREEARDQGQINAAITAEIHRGKAGGLYIDRREVLTAKIDGLSKDQLIDRLSELISKRAPRTIEGEVINTSTDWSLYSINRSTLLALLYSTRSINRACATRPPTHSFIEWPTDPRITIFNKPSNGLL